MKKISLSAFWILGCMLVLLSCTDEEQKNVAEEELPSQIVDNFQMQESKSGKELYFLQGRRAFYYDKQSEIVVLDPHITFYSSRREVTSVAVCDSGVISNKTGDLVAHGNVVVTTSDSTVLHTDSLVWFNRRAKIETDAEVTISSRQGTVKGKGFVSDADLDRIEIKEEIEGTTPFSVDEESE